MNITGTISQISKFFKGPQRYFYLDTYDPAAVRDSMGRVKCLGTASLLYEYMPVTLEGEYVAGVFVCNQISVTYTTKEEVVKYIHTRVKGSGIGVKKISAIVSLYGKEVLSFGYWEMHDHLVKDFPGIGEKSLEKFLDGLYKENPIVYLEEFFGPYSDVSHSTIEKIYAEKQEDAIERFKKNPYSECLKYDIKRRIAEKMAHDFKFDVYDDRRIIGLIRYALKDASSNGHTYIKGTELAIRVSNWSARSVYKTKIPAIYIANAVVANKWLNLDKNTGYISLRYINNDEINIAIRLKAINSAVKIKDEIEDSVIDSIEESFDLEFADEQREAFNVLSEDGIGILTGGPGTGKTSIIRGILSYYLAKHPFSRDRIKLAAPTGRAAKRLSEATGFTATTIHRLLEFRPFGLSAEPARTVNNPIEADFVIIDETSMCDTILLNMLLNAIPVGCRVLFVGDENQLPSVGAGNVLHDMILSDCFPVWRLIKNFRSDSSIINNAKRILEGEEPVMDDDFIIEKLEDEESLYERTAELIDKYYDNDDPFGCQIIEPSVKGVAGVYRVNSYVHNNVIHKDLGDNVSDDLMIGDKIMFKVNNYVENEEDDSIGGYVNGEIGIIKSMDHDELIFDNGEEEKVLPVSSLYDATLCYSCTIHKAQGSENDVVIICLPDSVSYMMNRNLLYTAITRAKKKIIIVYTGDALESCINDRYNVARKTRLAERLTA